MPHTHRAASEKTERNKNYLNAKNEAEARAEAAEKQALIYRARALAAEEKLRELLEKDDSLLLQAVFCDPCKAKV